jgi:hypothetical protein
MCYIVEEEIYSDSDKSSVYTSEDDFEEDRGVGFDFADNFPLMDEQLQQRTISEQ